MGFQKVLVANRGEIACRIMRTLKRLGISSVAVYSEIDRFALHVRDADEAYLLGAPDARESYLNISKIIEIAKASGADAIHPGYGFLSENPDFAKACDKAGITFIGPTPEVISLMGSKSQAKEIAEKAGLPLIPGYLGASQKDADLSKEALLIGFPLIIKAAMGGGGKGMRVVESESQFLEALASCRREAQSAFGDETVLLEKYIESPRHVEVQVFGDLHGNIVHLYERDCSLQRRHQKILEEAPAFGLSDELRKSMGAAAVQLAQVVKYTGAGTVEFLLDKSGKFYFMEMNTRLQVEHPVTEEITGLDLVEWQIKVAQGEELPLRQDQIQMQGHAVELRLYAEDPNRNFLPQTGELKVFDETVCDARIDSGVQTGSLITSYYDPMIAKLIVKGDSREQALDKARIALENWRVGGIHTNQAFLMQLLQDSRVIGETHDVGLLDRALSEFLTPHDDTILDLAAVLSYLVPLGPQRHSPWEQRNGWTISGYRDQIIQLETETSKTYHCRYSEKGWIIDNNDPIQPQWDHNGTLSFEFKGEVHNIFVLSENQNRLVFERGYVKKYQRAFPWDVIHAEHESEQHLKAPMTSKVIDVKVKNSDEVQSGDVLIVLEAMKMEHAIKAFSASRVKQVFYKVGDIVEEGAELIELEPHEEKIDALAKAS